MKLLTTLILVLSATPLQARPQATASAVDATPYAWYVGAELAWSGRLRTLPVDAPGAGAARSTSPPGFCPVPASYCPGAVNSTGSAAELAWLGSVSVSDNQLGLTASSLPNGELVTFFYGVGRASIPFGDGTLCVDPRGLGYVVRLRIVDLASFADTVTVMLDVDDPLLPPEATIVAGSVYQFQVWYRDPTGGPGGVNFTNALEIEFCP